jgi:hypothetical protein
MSTARSNLLATFERLYPKPAVESRKSSVGNAPPWVNPPYLAASDVWKKAFAEDFKNPIFDPFTMELEKGTSSETNFSDLKNKKRLSYMDEKDFFSFVPKYDDPWESP